MNNAMQENFTIVPSLTAEKWFPDGNYDCFSTAVFKYITDNPRKFHPNGDVIFDAIEMSDLVIAREDLGISSNDVPEEMFVGIVPRQVGTATKSGEKPGTVKVAGEETYVFKNSILVGNAGEVTNAVMASFTAWYDHAERVTKKTPRERAEERRRKRRRNKK